MGDRERVLVVVTGSWLARKWCRTHGARPLFLFSLSLLSSNSSQVATAKCGLCTLPNYLTQDQKQRKKRMNVDAFVSSRRFYSLTHTHWQSNLLLQFCCWCCVLRLPTTKSKKKTPVLKTCALAFGHYVFLFFWLHFLCFRIWS